MWEFAKGHTIFPNQPIFPFGKKKKKNFSAVHIKKTKLSFILSLIFFLTFFETQLFLLKFFYSPFQSWPLQTFSQYSTLWMSLVLFEIHSGRLPLLALLQVEEEREKLRLKEKIRWSKIFRENFIIN